MATITTIQGTDSLSASRQTLNDNFSAIATDLNDIDALLSINNSDLTVTSATIGSAVIGGSTIATTGNIIVADSQFSGKVTLNGGVVYDTETVITLPSANAWASTTYMVQAANATLSAATNGQQITLVGDFAGTVTVDASTVAGATTISIAQYGTLTLRYVGTSWYIISSFNATIA